MSLTTTQDNARLIDVMRGSLYPAARPESVELVLGYCAARKLDPMLKPVHIVPMYVKDPVTGQGGMRDVVMPGIGLYRIEAARTGDYAGKSEPEFGPDVALKLDGREYRVPEWCRVTVRRIVQGHVCEFTAKEYWIENYATAKRDSEAPNTMWAKRARGQLAKCAEAQALRMAFPEATGAEATGEEMEGKVLAPEMPPAAGPTITSTAERVTQPAAPEGYTMLGPDGVERLAPDLARWVAWCKAALGKLESGQAVHGWREAMAEHMDRVALVDDTASAAVAEAIEAAMDKHAEVAQ
ncbi:bet_lambda, phage recombination protein Bet [uncultured Caudovirales phage]|uniref:Bet_lambda, phage recombination protein Bet n=1 Tax=uncultured Caudovirales phage TaxID=2100421 RepID=A0A6J5NJG0_9CAUD|nr:bet_lambda, phage recombination protein Bet [uncultured Caudovirales phage]CAB5225537.1 bet_lambda, phage recombination protein Bet [uncultured Caudovirales phage]